LDHRSVTEEQEMKENEPNSLLKPDKDYGNMPCMIFVCTQCQIRVKITPIVIPKRMDVVFCPLCHTSYAIPGGHTYEQVPKELQQDRNYKEVDRNFIGRGCAKHTFSGYDPTCTDCTVEATPQLCTRSLPHICCVNGPCNGFPRPTELNVNDPNRRLDDDELPKFEYPIGMNRDGFQHPPTGVTTLTIPQRVGIEKNTPENVIDLLYQMRYICRCVAPIRTMEAKGMGSPWCGYCRRLIQED
jgi:hypothetical protein